MLVIWERASGLKALWDYAVRRTSRTSAAGTTSSTVPHTRDSAMTAVLHAGGLGAGNTLVVVVIARVWGTVLEVVPAALVLLEIGRAHV